MQVLGKAFKKWQGFGWSPEDCAAALGWFFEEPRKDHDPLFLVKAFDNGYTARLKVARDKAQDANASDLARDLETIREARERWQGSREQRDGRPDAFLKNIMGGLWTAAPYPPRIGAALRDLAVFLGVEAPC